MEKLKISFLLMIIMFSFPMLTLAQELTISQREIKKGDCLKKSKDICLKKSNKNLTIYQKIKPAIKKEYLNYEEIENLRTKNSETYLISTSTFLTKIYFADNYIINDGVFYEFFYKEKETSMFQSLKNILINGANALIDTTAGNNKDTYLEGYAPTTARGSLIEMQISNYGDAVSKPDRIILQSTIPTKTGYTIDKIRLALYKTDEDFYQTFYLNAHSLTRTDWVESQATYNNYKTGSAWTTAGGDYSATVIDSILHNTAVNNWDYWVLQGTGSDNPLSKNWGDNLDILIKVNNENRTYDSNNYYASKEYTDTTKRPYVEITYSINTTMQTFEQTKNIQEWVINATSTDNNGVSTYLSYSGSSPFFLFLEIVIVIFLFFYLFFKFREIGRKK